MPYDEANGAEKIDVAYVAHLARLALSDAEVATLQGQLEQIVEYVRQIGRLDLEGVEPTSHPFPVQNVFREDGAAEGLSRDEVLGNAPLHRDGQFQVPKIVE